MTEKMETREKLERLEQKTGYAFRDKRLLRQALTHSSFANEQKINKWEDYERLEFLGDAVLELVSSEFLFEIKPPMPEGKMTKMRSSMVCEPALAYCAREIDLEDFIFLGKGEEGTGGRKRDSIVSDVLEALIGGIYLDGGLARAREFIRRFILSDLEHKQLFYDSKTILQEEVQREQLGGIVYELTGESGPEHDKTFQVKVLVDGKEIGEGNGRTKKLAEQQAAYQALLSMRKNRK